MAQNRNQKIPKYQVIERDLLSMIKGGHVAVGEQIPTEVSLSKKYRVSRLTARKALGSLEDRGYLKRMPGRGTFVRPWQDNGRRVVSATARNITVLVVDKAGGSREGWDAGLLRTAVDEAERLGYHVTLAAVTAEQLMEGNLPLAIREKTAVGAIVDGYISDIALHRLVKSELPFVLVGSHENKYGVPEICHDAEDMAYRLTTAMLRLDRGPVWMVGPFSPHYYFGQMLLKGYQRAILECDRPDRLVHYNVCEAQQCGVIVRQMARMDQRRHCIIVLDVQHFRSLLEEIRRLGLAPENFTFVNVGRYRKEWHEKGEFMFCEIEPSMVAREAVRQMVALAEHDTPLRQRHFKLRIETVRDDVNKPLRFSWI